MLIIGRSWLVGLSGPLIFWPFCPFSLQVASAPARCSPEGCSHVRVLFQSQDAAVCDTLRYSSFREIDMVNWQNIYVRWQKWMCSGAQQKLTGVNAAATQVAKSSEAPLAAECHEHHADYHCLHTILRLRYMSVRVLKSANQSLLQLGKCSWSDPGHL